MSTMKKTFILLAAVCLCFAFVVDKPKKVIFFGDSITQAAVKPNGYIVRIGEALEKQGKKEAYELIGAGIGGNKVYDLFLRLESDVLEKKPDVVFIYVGVNDVWHKTTSGTGTDANKFEAFYQALINKIQANGAKVILCTPAVIGERTDFRNPQDGDMNHYANIIRKIAAKNNVKLVDLRKAFLAYNKDHNPDNKESGILTTDRVHLNDVGNQLVADQMLEALVQ